MSNFYRTVRIALRRKTTVVGIVVCSIMVGLLWGANIGTIYPFVEVVVDGHSMHAWVDGKIDDAEENVAEFEAAVEDLEERVVAAPAGTAGKLQRELRAERQRLQVEREARERMLAIRPYVLRWTPATPFATLLLIVAVLLVGTLVKDAFLFVNVLLVERLSQKATFDLRGQFYRHTLRMDLGSLGNDHTTQLMARFTHDMSAITAGLHTLFGRALREPLKIVACVAVAAAISWRLLLLSLVVAPLAAFLVQKLAKAIRRASRRAMEEMTQLYAVLSESLAGIQIVKAYTMEAHERRRFHLTSKHYLQKSLKIAAYNAMLRPATEVLGMAAVGMAIIAGGYLVLNQETALLGIPITQRPLDRGALMTFFAMLIGISDPARKLADVYSLVQRGAAGADRVYEMLDRVPKLEDPPRPVPMPDPFREIVFQDVHFAYQPEQPVLRGIDLRVARGETVAIVGANGCGKSTLVHLLPRFYDPRQGSIRLDLVDLREMRRKDLRDAIGLVTQQTLLFDTTVLENIRYGSPHATEDEVREAARRAHADAFIERRLSDGYATRVGERGGRLSGGQRQRIALARAILRDPAILLLDEATSQVDLESEQLIHLALREFLPGRTTLMVTHRLSTLELADRVVVMDAGRIVDTGSHAELICRCPLYQRLHEIQLRESA